LLPEKIAALTRATTTIDYAIAIECR